MSESLPRVFISGPHGRNGEHLAALDAARRKLHEVGIVPQWNWRWAYAEDYARRAGLDARPHAMISDPLWIVDCCADVSACDGVALLDGWLDSPGAMLEVGYAHARGLPILRLVRWCDGSWRDWGTRAAAQREAFAEAGQWSMP